MTTTRRRLHLVSLFACAAATANVGCGQADTKDAATRGSFATLGVTVEELGVAGVPAGARLRAKYGDVLLSNGALHAALERAARPTRERPRTGMLIDLFTNKGTDLLEQTGAAIVFGESPAVPVTYGPAERVPHSGKTPPFVRATGTASSTDGSATVEVTTEYRMTSGLPVLRVIHVARNTGAAPVQLLLCESAYLGNHPAWLPGHGPALEKTEVTGPWIGVGALGSGYALGPASGEATFWAKVVSIHEARFYSGLLACPAPTSSELAPGAEVRSEWLWSAHPVDVAGAAAAVAAARGDSLVPVKGTVTSAPLPGSPPARELFVVAEVAGKPYVRARVVGGAFQLALPPGEARLRVVGHGRADGPARNLPLVAGSTPSSVELAAAGAGVIHVRTTMGGVPLPARVLFLGPEGAEPDIGNPLAAPLLGPKHRADGAGNSIYTLDGEASAALPPGRYRVRATRGLEYTLPEATVTVEAGKVVEAALEINLAVETPSAVACDFHLHAIGSRDSDVLLPDRVISLIAEGIEFAVSTDHNRLTDYAPVLEELAAAPLLRTSIGEEISTKEPKIGHFNVFPFPVVVGESGRRVALDPVRSWKTTPTDIFGDTRDMLPKDEIIQVNHPRMEPDIGYFDVMGLDPATGVAANLAYSDDFDAIEVFNGLELAHLEVVETNLRDWYSLLNRGLKPTATGNSDSHHLWLHEVGYPRTYVFMDGIDLPTEIRESAVVAALRAGRAMVTSGPYLLATVAGARPGDLVSVTDGRAVVEIEVRVAPWVSVSEASVVRNGETIATTPLNAKEGIATARLEIPVARDSWVVVLVRGKTPYAGILPIEGVLPFAFQNPVWVDVDGDGKWTAPRP